MSSAKLLMRCPQQRWTTLAFRPRGCIVGWLKHVPDGREAKQPGTGTPESVNKEEQCQQQAKFLQRNTWKRDTWRITEHNASNQEANDNWDNKFEQDESNVIINTDQKGSCLSPRQRISETRMKPISRRSRPWLG